MELLVFLLSTVAITHIIVGSSIFGPVRVQIINLDWAWLKELVTCYQCSGFWVGVGMYFLWLWMFEHPIGGFLKAFFIAGPLVSLFSDLTYRLKKFLCEDY